MKILAVGDLVGENGLDKLKQVLPKLKEEAQIDFVIVNAENVAGGMGITFKNWNDLLKLPIDVVTMGNHTWAKKDIFQFTVVDGGRDLGVYMGREPGYIRPQLKWSTL